MINVNLKFPFVREVTSGTIFAPSCKFQGLRQWAMLSFCHTGTFVYITAFIEEMNSVNLATIERTYSASYKRETRLVFNTRERAHERQ